MTPDDLDRPEAYPVSTDGDFEPVLVKENESEQASERAFQASARGAWLEAGRAFVEAARAVILPEGTPTWEIAARNRGRFYANANLCFRAAGALDEVRQTFASLAAADPRHGALLLRLSDGSR